MESGVLDEEVQISICRSTRSATLIHGIDRMVSLGRLDLSAYQSEIDATTSAGSNDCQQDKIGDHGAAEKISDNGCGMRRFSLHVLGADENECPSLNAELMATLYQDLLQKLISLKLSNVAIFFCGPNLTCLRGTNNGAKIEFSYMNLLNVTIYASSAYYHSVDRDFLFCDYPEDAYPNLAVLYNPGIWGYPSWLDTLSTFYTDHGVYSSSSSSSNIFPTVYLLTSYTLEEAEEDYDVIVSHFESEGLSSKVLSCLDKDKSMSSASKESDSSYEVTEDLPNPTENNDLDSILWLWECEGNPFCTSRELTRNSKSKGTYRDSQIWSAFMFNTKTMTLRL